MKFAVIFDMDGTLINSASYIPTLVDRVAQSYGLKLSPSELAESTHFPFSVWVGNWNKRHNRNIAVHEVIQKYAIEEREHLKNYSPLAAGVIPLLKDLRANHVALGIATSAPRARLDNLLNLTSIAHFFDATISIDDVTFGKPDPEPYLKTAQQLTISPTHCIGIEDTNTGLASVKSAGMKSIGYAPTAVSRDSLVSADLIISNFAELSFHSMQKLVEK